MNTEKAIKGLNLRDNLEDAYGKENSEKIIKELKEVLPKVNELEKDVAQIILKYTSTGGRQQRGPISIASSLVSNPVDTTLSADR